MASSSTLDKLIEMTRSLLDEAAVTLGKSIQNQTKAKSFLETLEGYRQDYIRDMEKEMIKGMDSMTACNYRDFLKSLDSYIKQAKDSLRSASAEVDECRGDWQRENLKLNRFSTVQNKQNLDRSTLERRREQKNLDELSTQMYSRHSNSFGMSR